MGNPERSPLPAEETEFLDPKHFYAAYVFDWADERQKDIQAILENAQDLDYPVRYWWLSDAMELHGFPNRLIVCVHHPSNSEDAGMDLYEALREKGVTWDDLEAAAVDEYRYIGTQAFEVSDLRSPYGNWLFPNTVSDERRPPNPEDALLVITPENLRDELANRLGREVSDAELSATLVYFRKAVEQKGWIDYLDEALKMSVEDRQKRWKEGQLVNSSTDIHSETDISVNV